MRRIAMALVMAGVVLGCGPSLRRVQQSNVYFERCYAADFDPRVPLAEKHACWSAWREHYAAGQPQERLEYAQARIYAIEHSESVPRLPGLPEAAMGPRRMTAVTAASTTEAPPEPDPPAVAEQESLRERRARRRRHRRHPLPRTTNRICATAACEPAYRECLDTCARGNEACETACEVELQACARGCF